MADLNFACPHCQQTIACDEQWSGHQIQCPICNGALTVPAAAPAHPPAAAHKPAGGAGARLAQNAQKPAETGNRNIPIRNLAGPAPKKQNKLVGILAGTAVIAGLAAGGYFGYGWYKDKQEKKAQAEAAAQQAAAEAAAAQQAAQAPPPPVAPTPPTYTLDVAQAKIPEGPVNGSISGSNFVAEETRIDALGTAQVLRFYQGMSSSPDREVLVYLHLKAGEKLGGQSLTVSNLMKGVPQVAKRWKSDPRYAPSINTYSSGYAMKLELGKAAEDGTSIPGKIFIALPDKEKTVIAGNFKAAMTPADPNAQPMPVQYQTPQAAPQQPGGFNQSTYDRRYGTRRR